MNTITNKNETFEKLQLKLFREVVLILIAVQLLFFCENIILWTQKEEKTIEQQFAQVIMHFLIMCAHLFLCKVLIKKEATRFAIINLCCFIFAGQQLQLYIRYQPIQGDLGGAYQNFRDQSLIQLLCCGCMVGPFLPLCYYLAPICLIYAGSFWAVYLN